MSNTVDFVYWISVPHFRPKSSYWMLPAIEVSVYQIEVFDSYRVQGVGNDFDFQFGDTARYRDVDGCG